MRNCPDCGERRRFALGAAAVYGSGGWHRVGSRPKVCLQKGTRRRGGFEVGTWDAAVRATWDPVAPDGAMIFEVLMRRDRECGQKAV